MCNIFEVFEFIVPLNLLKLITSLSKDGVLIKSSNTIEKINECEVVMIEKSGVLIEEYPDVKDVFILEKLPLLPVGKVDKNLLKTKIAL